MSPLAYAAFLSITGGLPAGYHDPARIAALIRDLDSYRFAQRDFAAKQLRGIGLPALAPLKEAIAAPPSPEAAEQMQRIAREIRRQSISGGRVVNGLRATLRTAEDTYAEESDIVLELEVTNVARTSCPIHPPVWWKISHAATPDDTDLFARPLDGEILIHRLDGRLWKKSSFFATAERRSKFPTELVQGQAAGDAIPLGEHGRDLPAGEYEVQIVLPGARFTAADRELLTSNSTRFSIVSRKKQP